MKVFIVYKENGKNKTVQVDTDAAILFTPGGFIEYETFTEFIQDDVKNIVKIYFE